MNARRIGLYIIGAAAAVAAIALTVVAAWGDGAPAGTVRATAPPNAIPMAVLGDSNSHSYQDRISFPPGSAERGGARRAHTFQWTEALARMRGNEIYLGPWVVWGRPWPIAWARDIIGLLPSRSPIKEDYLYNFARSSAGCRHLMGELRGQPYRQAPRLVALMDQNPEQWRRGVVVISIGPVDWNSKLDLQAEDPSAPELRAVIDYCALQIRRTIDLIHASHPSTRILLEGWGNSADEPEFFDKYRNAAAAANIKKALATANAEFRKIAEADPKRITYLDYDSWFTQRWGERGPNGEPDGYKAVQLGPALRITNTTGDAPENFLIQDGHVGTAANAMWGQETVKHLREAFGMPLTPISDEEVARFVTE